MLLFHLQHKAWCFHLNVYPYTVPGGYLKHEPVVGAEMYEKYKFISKYLKFHLCNYSEVNFHINFIYVKTVKMQSKNNLYTHLQHFISTLNTRNTAAKNALK